MKKLGQEGFTLIEGLLIVIALSLVGGVGYYVYSVNKDIEKPESTSQTSRKAKASPTEQNKDYLNITELSLRIDKSILPTAYYKISSSEAQRSYPKVPELRIIELYDSKFDDTKNSTGQTCGSLGSGIVKVEIMSIADRDKKYSNYKNAELGPNDDVPTVVSDKYAKEVGDYLYDYYKAQGVQAPISCVQGLDSAQNEQAQSQFDNSYKKLEQMLSTLEKSS